MYRHIMVGLSGQDRCECVLPHAEELARRFGARLTLVQVTPTLAEVVARTSGLDAVEPYAVDPRAVLDGDHASALAYLERLAGPLRAQGIDVAYEHVQGHTAEALVERARDLGADLLACVTRGRGGFDRLFHGGSTAEAVLHHAPCPVLVIRRP